MKNNNEDFWWEDILTCRNNKENYEGKINQLELSNLINKTCPKCGGEVEKFYFKSPEDTWKGLCGTAGYMEVCFKCKKQLYYKSEILS